MTNNDATNGGQNFSLFRDCLASRVLLSLSNPAEVDEEEDFADFLDYLATEVWPSLPEPLRDLSHESAKEGTDLDDLAFETLPLSFTDTLVSYSIVPPGEEDEDAPSAFLRKVLVAYIQLAIAPPPAWSSTRSSECEICERDVPLTYHHLIPRSVHTKVLKRGWHAENILNSVAWLCRPCHSVVHSVATCEVLARQYYTVERLLEREDIQKWRKYASKQRWGTQKIRWTKNRER